MKLLKTLYIVIIQLLNKPWCFVRGHDWGVWLPHTIPLTDNPNEPVMAHKRCGKCGKKTYGMVEWSSINRQESFP